LERHLALGVPYTVTEFRETPNPNALKCVLDRSPGPTPRSYREANAAAGDPLAAVLFGVPGVTGLLIHDGWVTVSKSDSAKWAGIKTALRAAFAAAP
jgi:NFU1 iron-sulfur cluster scaffold homolog, mitochondrial